VRATLRAVTLQNPPAAALELMRLAMATDLERTSSFVTLFHARLEVASRRLSYVDAGHGHAFLLRDNGTAEELPLGGPPLGVLASEAYQEGTVTLGPADAVVVYSDGLVEGEAPLDRRALVDQLRGVTKAAAMVERLTELAAASGPPQDDLTVVVLRSSG
jgi:phosphoserine phosphatase RsbU/P